MAELDWVGVESKGTIHDITSVLMARLINYGFHALLGSGQTLLYESGAGSRPAQRFVKSGGQLSEIADLGGPARG